MSEATKRNSTIAVRQMLKDMDRVHNEASREGFGDELALVRLFGPAEEFEVKDLFAEFWPPLIGMKEAAAAFSESPSDATREAFLQKHKDFVDSSQTIEQALHLALPGQISEHHR